MFHCLHYFVMFNESKEKFKVVVCWVLAIKSIVALSFYPDFPMKLILWRENLFVFVDKSIPVSL